MKGHRILKEGDIIKKSDEMYKPWQSRKSNRWEVVGDHMAGVTYKRHELLLTMRRKLIS